MRAGDARVGAVASFIGTVRDVNDAATVSTLTLEHYPGMTENALEAIVGEAMARSPRTSRVTTRPPAPHDRSTGVAVRPSSRPTGRPAGRSDDATRRAS